MSKAAAESIRHAGDSWLKAVSPPTHLPPLAPGLLRGIEAVCVIAGISISCALTWRGQPMPGSAELLLLAVGALATLNLLHLLGAYRHEAVLAVNTGLMRCLVAMIVAGAAIVGLAMAIDADLLARTRAWLLPWLAIALAFLATVRLTLALWLRHRQATGASRQRIAILGAETIGQRLLQRLHAHPDEIEIVGVYDDRKDRLPVRCMGHAIKGGIDTLLRDLRERPVDRVIVALPLAAERRVHEVLRALRHAPVDILLCPDLAGLRFKSLSTQFVGGVPLMVGVDRPIKAWDAVMKAALDRVLAACILLAIMPLMLAIAACIKLDSPGPVLFRQKRYGFNNTLIDVFKFRTMRADAADRNAERLTTRNDPRVTRVGAFLRRTSLDELPQFLNVLRGEMSVVGPRPHATAAKAGGLLYPEAVRDYHARHRVKPGITGWAQVNGWRGETETVEQIVKRVEHDLYYIDHWSVGLDLWIVARTILGGFVGRNAY